MPIYVIGDVQGCFLSLQRLLRQIDFDPARDRLWLAGDLVNRGPRSLETLRWAYRHRSIVTTVLGNHDLHLLACAEGLRQARTKDTLGDVLAAEDGPLLLDWLRRRPFLHEEGGFVLVHAGLLPVWTLEEAATLAREIEAALRDSAGHETLKGIYGAPTVAWNSSLRGGKRWRALAAVFTTLRMCGQDGRPFYDFSGAPELAPHGLLPWYEVPHRRGDTTVLFGHWAALGFRTAPGAVALDSGCVWGGKLTAVRLPDLAVYQSPNVDMGGAEPPEWAAENRGPLRLCE